MSTLPFPPYEPDKNNQNLGALSVVLNVVPHADGFGPLPAIVPTPAIYDYLVDQVPDHLTDQNGNRLIIASDYSGLGGEVRLPATCTGMFAARRKDGTEVQFAGTETGLYKFNKTSLVWEDVSSTTYASDVRWSFAKKGSVIYAQNGFNAEQQFDIETDTVFSDNPTAPICRYLAMIGPFLFRAYIVSWAAEGIADEPSMVMCSSLLSPADNVPYNLNYCDYQSVQSGDEITGIIPMTGGAHLWTKGGLVPLTLEIGDYTFTLGEEDRTRGTSAPYSLYSFGQDRYIVYADDGFLLYQGSMTPMPIGQDRVNTTFLSNVDQNTFGDMVSMMDPEHAVIWIAYTNTDGNRRMLGYQYNIDQFTASDIEVAASVVARTFVYATSVPPILVANQPRFTIIDMTGQAGYLVGDPMAARITTNEAQLGEDRSFQNGVRLNGDPVNFTVTTITRDKKGGTTRSRTAASPSSLTGAVPVSAEGFTHQWQVDIPAGEDWTNVTGMDVPGKPAGKR
jgi:hypothetical protein